MRRGLVKHLAVALLAAASMAGAALAGEDEQLPSNTNVLEWTPEEQRVGYRRVEDIAPHRVIARGPHARVLHYDARPFSPAIRIGDDTLSVADYMAAYRTSGLLVLKDGRILLERYGLGRTEEDRWTSFSVAKSVTSLLVGAAIKDGAIASLDAPVDAYLAELKGSAYEGVTVRQLLTMTSGAAWNEDYSDPNSDVARAGFVPVEPGMNPLIGYLRRLPRAAPPGTRFNYSTGETDLVGHLVSRATGKTLAEYASEKIWRPFGMERDGIWALDGPDGHERGGCCISMTLRDYGRLGLLMLEGSDKMTPPWWAVESTRRQVPFSDHEGYGYFWWIDGKNFSARGIFGQMIYVVPEQSLVIVLNSAWPRAGGDDLMIARQALVDGIIDAARKLGTP